MFLVWDSDYKMFQLALRSQVPPLVFEAESWRKHGAISLKNIQVQFF